MARSELAMLISARSRRRYHLQGVSQGAVRLSCDYRMVVILASPQAVRRIRARSRCA